MKGLIMTITQPHIVKFDHLNQMKLFLQGCFTQNYLIL